MTLRWILLPAALLALSAPAAAQDSAQPTPTPTAQPRPISPAIPSDFSLTPGDNQPQAQPTPQSTPRPTQQPTAPVVQPVPSATATPRPTSSATSRQTAPVREPLVRPTAPAETPAPGSSDGTEIGASAETSPQITAPAAATPTPPVAAVPEATADEPAESAGWGTLGIILAAIAISAAAALGLVMLWRRRRDEVVVERAEPHREKDTAPDVPHVGKAATEPASAPVAPAEPQSVPQPQSTRAMPDPSTLVTISPSRNRAARAPQPSANNSAASGLVTTNLAAKHRAEAEARERARVEAQRRSERARQARTPARVKRSVSFDWN